VTQYDYLVWSYEHTAWWKPNSLGYTSKVSEAGRYPLYEAVRICMGANIANNWSEGPMESIVPVVRVSKTRVFTGDFSATEGDYVG